MEHNLKSGMIARIDLIVEHKHTAAAFGSGEVTVFATPMMIGIMEQAALTAVDSQLPKGYATVGTHLDVKHLAATPIGMKVYAEAELVDIKGKALRFDVKAYDEKGLIGKGSHDRYIINLEQFLSKIEPK